MKKKIIVTCTVGYFYNENLCVNNLYVLRLLFLLELLIRFEVRDRVL